MRGHAQRILSLFLHLLNKVRVKSKFVLLGVLLQNRNRVTQTFLDTMMCLARVRNLDNITQRRLDVGEGYWQKGLGNNQFITHKFCKGGAPAIIQLNPAIALMKDT